jgi:hypothetical protein
MSKTRRVDSSKMSIGVKSPIKIREPYLIGGVTEIELGDDG